MKFFYYYSVFTLTLAFGVSVYVAWLFLAPVHLDGVYNEPFPVYPAEVSVGETLYWEVEYSKDNDYTVDINRNIICGDDLVTLAPESTNVPQTERSLVTGSVVIPSKAGVGTCFVELRAEYHINKLRTIQKTFKTQEFDIIQ